MYTDKKHFVIATDPCTFHSDNQKAKNCSCSWPVLMFSLQRQRKAGQVRSEATPILLLQTVVKT